MTKNANMTGLEHLELLLLRVTTLFGWCKIYLIEISIELCKKLNISTNIFQHICSTSIWNIDILNETAWHQYKRDRILPGWLLCQRLHAAFLVGVSLAHGPVSTILLNLFVIFVHSLHEYGILYILCCWPLGSIKYFWFLIPEVSKIIKLIIYDLC